jgi:hypothetical protein
MDLSIVRLPSGYYHIRGKGPCNWTQPPHWPCNDAVIFTHAFPQASIQFLRAVRAARDAADAAKGE